MIVIVTPRGFEHLQHECLPDGAQKTLVMQSSAIGDYTDAFDRPGSSFLRLGDHHLNREQAAMLAAHLLNWCKTGSLQIEERP